MIDILPKQVYIYTRQQEKSLKVDFSWLPQINRRNSHSCQYIFFHNNFQEKLIHKTVLK